MSDMCKSAKRYSRGLSNGQFLEIVEKFCYSGETIGAREGAVDSVMTKIRRGWSKFSDSVPLLATRGLPLEAKGRLYFACVRSVMLYGTETWPVKEEDVIRIEMNNAKDVQC